MKYISKKYINHQINKCLLFRCRHAVVIMQTLNWTQRRVEALPGMHCNSLIFTIMIFHNVSWKSCGYLFRYFATKSSYFWRYVFIIVLNMSQINDFCFIWCFNDVQLYANRNLYWPVFRVNAQVSKILKIRTPEMPFAAILALNSKLQYDLKKGQNFAILPYFSQKWQFDHQFEEVLQNCKLRIQG
jgi:hypothetical protein